MRKALVIILLLVAVSYTFGKDCPERPNNCKVVLCERADPRYCEKQGLDFVAKETVCGCCDYCQPYIDRGQPCGNKTEATNSKAPRNCQPPSTCENGVCIEPNWK